MSPKRRNYQELPDIELSVEDSARIEAATRQAEADVEARHGARTRAGMKLAQDRGASIGRPRKGPTVEEVMTAMEKHRSYQGAARSLGSTKTTVRRRYQEGLADKQRKKGK